MILNTDHELFQLYHCADFYFITYKDPSRRPATLIDLYKESADLWQFKAAMHNKYRFMPLEIESVCQFCADAQKHSLKPDYDLGSCKVCQVTIRTGTQCGHLPVYSEYANARTPDEAAQAALEIATTILDHTPPNEDE